LADDAGGPALVPAVYFTHRTWINRIRPLYRDIHTQRQDIDGQTTEAFGGMRVVRTYGHRLSTITNSDRIVVLEQGRIIEIGTHDELIFRSGRYRQMVEVQLGNNAFPPEPVARDKVLRLRGGLIRRTM
jgi:ABC-type multidrug transport system fused ATPase/permease subunit